MDCGAAFVTTANADIARVASGPIESWLKADNQLLEAVKVAILGTQLDKGLLVV